MTSRKAAPARIFLAFVAGIWLYQVAVVVGGFLASIAIPKAYFAWFGRSHVELALAVFDTATFAVPIALLLAGGTLAAYRLLGPLPLKAFMLALCLGAISCFAFWVALSVLFVPDLPYGVQPYPPTVLLKQLLMPPWWAVPNMLAPWLGLAFAGWLLSAGSAARRRVGTMPL